MFAQDHHAQKSEIHDPNWRRAIQSVFHGAESARKVWARHVVDPALTPSQFVSCTDGTRDLIGVVIGGTIPDAEDPCLWDTESTFTLLTEDAEILIVKGWYATSLEQFVESGTEGVEKMKSQDQTYRDDILDVLVIKAGLAQQLDQSPAAKGFWDIHLERLGAAEWPEGPLPQCLVRFDERENPRLGLVISGAWIAPMGDWDLTQPFLAISTDGEIMRSEGCLAEQVSVL
ncbi:hypothetical protein [Acetobacter pasteurianus]|uniref:hypothetical protein n=1 Tax=Acetobacter pasteurianus TaxID=438 RepID=UPI003D0AED1C